MWLLGIFVWGEIRKRLRSSAPQWFVLEWPWWRCSLTVQSHRRIRHNFINQFFKVEPEKPFDALHRMNEEHLVRILQKGKQRQDCHSYLSPRKLNQEGLKTFLVNSVKLSTSKLSLGLITSNGYCIFKESAFHYLGYYVFTSKFLALKTKNISAKSGGLRNTN